MRQRHRCVCPRSPVEETRVCHNHRLGLFLALLLHTCPFCPVPRFLKASPCHSSPMSLFNQTPMLVPPKASCCPLALSSSQPPPSSPPALRQLGMEGASYIGRARGRAARPDDGQGLGLRDHPGAEGLAGPPTSRQRLPPPGHRGWVSLGHQG